MSFSRNVRRSFRTVRQPQSNTLSICRVGFFRFLNEYFENDSLDLSSFERSTFPDSELGWSVPVHCVERRHGSLGSIGCERNSQGRTFAAQGI